MLQQAVEKIREADLTVSRGRVERVNGLSVESVGPAVRIGEVCHIYPNAGGTPVMAEVVGFRDNSMLLMPYDNLQGVGPGSMVESTGHSFYVRVGTDMVGRVLDGIGNPIDGKGPITVEARYTIDAEPANPLQRPRIKECMPLGVKVLDGLLTCGRGQRIGIFAGS